MENNMLALSQAVVDVLINHYEDLQADELDENLSRRYYSILMSLYDIKEDLKDGKVF